MYPSLIETFINMKRTCKTGKYEFSLNVRQHDKNVENDYFSYMYSPKSIEHTTPSTLFTSLSSFPYQDAIYGRSLVKSEISHLVASDREKLFAEEEILKAIVIYDYNVERNAMTVCKDIVQDVEFFFKMMALAS